MPLGVQGDELAGHVLGGAFGAGAGLGPFGPSHFGELYRTLFPAAGIFGHHVQLGGGDIEHIRPGVAELDVVFFKSVHLHLDDAGEASDAVGLVDHIVPHGEVGIALNALPVRRELFGSPSFSLSADDLCVCQDCETQ